MGKNNMLLSTESSANVAEHTYLLRSTTNTLIALGYLDDATGKNYNYGIDLTAHGIDGTAEHVYWLYNKLLDGGGNMVYLSVDGVEVGPMNNHYVGLTDRNETSDWLSGKDITFTFIGTYNYLIKTDTLSYLQIHEDCVHSYENTVTAPTCTEEGFATYTCTQCGHTYTADSVAAVGHSYADGYCTRCGEADPDYTVPVAAYALVGEMNGWDETAHIMTDDGTVSVTLTLECDSYEFKIRHGDTWYGNDGIVLDTTATTSETGWDMSTTANNCTLNATGGAYTFVFDTQTNKLIIIYSNNETEVDPVPAGTITLKNVSLSLEDEIRYNIYYEIADMTVSEADMGLSIWDSEPAVPTINCGGTVIAGATYVPANENMRALCVALMNYGAAAQEFFASTGDYTYTELMNVGFETYQDLVKPYDSSMLEPQSAVDTAKAGTLGTDMNGFRSRSASMSADGSFALNYYFTTTVEVEQVTFYYWTAAKYASVDVLTLENASGSKKMILSGTANTYWANYTGIAAKDMDKSIFVCGVYEKGGVQYSTGVFSYSLAQYCINRAEVAGEISSLAAATAVYGYYAKTYFAN